LLIGCVASAFLAAMERMTRWPIEQAWARIAIAGVTTGVASIALPEVMGIGYDTVERALQGDIALRTLAVVVVGKVFVSAVTYALRVPVGIIGPTLVIGACMGAVLGTTSRLLVPDFASDTAVYVVLGMGAMMGAVLQAPLAALIAVVELTGTPNITLPAMLAIVVATITTNSLFKQRSVFLAALDARGLSYPADPIAQHMQRTGVSGVMERSLVRLREDIDRREAAEALQGQPRWIVVEDGGGPLYVLSAADLLHFLDGFDGSQQDDEGAKIDLRGIPGVRMDVASIDVRSTMYEAWDALKDSKVEVLCVRRTTAPMIATTLGVLTREDVVRFARFDH
jgi:CIC family chloride channel protein